MYFPSMFMLDNDMPVVWPVWTPGAPLAGFINRSTIHCSTQNMKALGHVASYKKIVYVFFSKVSQWELLTPRGVAIFDPRGMNRRIIVKLYKNAAYEIYKFWLL